MTPSFQRLSVFGMLAAVTWSVAACAPMPAVPTPTPASAPLALKLGLQPASATAPIIVPAEEGQFTARGLNLSVEPVTDPNQALILAATGQFDIVYAPMAPAALNAFNRGAAVKIVAAGAAQPPGHGDNTPVVVRTQLIDSGEVKTVADLRGRKVAIITRGASEYKLTKALAIGGLIENDVDVQIMAAPAMVAALSTGAIDAGLLLQPTAAQAVATGVGKILLDEIDPLGQGGVVVASTRFLDQHPEAVTSFLEVYLQAIRRLSDGKIKSDDQALAAIQKYTDVPPDVIRLGPDPYWPADGHVLVDSLRDAQDFYIRTGNTDYSQPLDIEKLIDYGPLDAALKNIGG
jgi:ABC-type nitrate/sulfonate/bicarbonate transport system substrate-binding protein